MGCILDKYFDGHTMSVHLRENHRPYAKKGKPGAWESSILDPAIMSQAVMLEIGSEIIDEAKARDDSFVEIAREGSTIVQLGTYRIVITRPPLSDAHEITAVRPIKQLKLSDYSLSAQLMNRIGSSAEGILVAGAPGMGKSTFVQGLAEHYSSCKKTVKTIEAPRDLILSESITQYSISHADKTEIHDLLLLTRPDHTIFDEMRNTADFHLFSDLRLAGVGMVGVVHATQPVDAIQRFIGRIEMGIIPQVIDTVIFIQNGAVDTVLNLQIVVKVPHGMTEADLARPCVVVSDFESGMPCYEIYTYGDQTVVVPVNGECEGVHRLASDSIQRMLNEVSSESEVEVLSNNKCIIRVPADKMKDLIGPGGRTVQALESKLGLSIDVQALNKKCIDGKSEIKYDMNISKTSVTFQLPEKYCDTGLDIVVNGDYLLSAKSSKCGEIKVKKNNPVGKLLVKALNSGDRIMLLSE